MTGTLDHLGVPHGTGKRAGHRFGTFDRWRYLFGTTVVAFLACSHSMPVPPGHPNSVQGPYLLSCVRHGSAHGLVGQRHRALALRAGAWLLGSGRTESWYLGRPGARVSFRRDAFRRTPSSGYVLHGEEGQVPDGHP